MFSWLSLDSFFAGGAARSGTRDAYRRIDWINALYWLTSMLVVSSSLVLDGGKDIEIRRIARELNNAGERADHWGLPVLRLCKSE